MIRLIPLLLSAIILLQAASTKVWEISDRDDFLPGDFAHVSLDPEGRLRPSSRLEEIFTSEEAVAWDAVRDERGRLWVATGHHGQLFRVEPDGDAESVWKAPEIEIFALAPAPGGGVYAGTSPKGKVYRVGPDGDAEELFDPGQEYIWTLAVGPDGAVFVGTGGEGKIYRIEPDGSGEEYFDSGQRHVVSLAFDSAGALLAGTDPNGILFRVEAPGEAFALYDSSLPEVRAVAALPNGDIAFTAMGGGISFSDQLTQAVQQAATFAVTATASSGGGTPQQAQTQQQPLVLNRPAVNYGVETSAVFVLRPDAKIEEQWSSKSENILGMAPDPGASGRFLFLSDTDARLRRLDDESRETLISEASELQATSLRVAGSEILVPAAHPASVRRLTASDAATGVYTTGVRDASAPARWGRLTWRGSGNVEIQTRSGNTGQPGETWSDWSEPVSGSGALITSPAARYLQWRARLASDAMIETVRISYLPQNQTPTIDSITIAREVSNGSSSNGSNGSASSSSATGAYTISVTATADGNSNGSTTSSASGTESTDVGRNGSGKLAISWSASDPDSDDLLAKVEFRGEGETTWKVLEDDVSESKVTLDGQSLADGRYWFRVTVSDAPGNPPDDARTAQRTSAPVRIDHTPPAVRLIEGLRFEAVDAASPLEQAEYSINAGPWTPVYPDDGVTDATRETFTVPEPPPADAERLLTLRVWDAAGNAGLAKTLLQP